jgi:hypothetical protein
VAGGLVYATREGTLLVWDPERRAIVQTLPGIETGSAHGQRVATCDERSLYVTDVGTGIQQSFSLPEGFAAFECRASAFSPDGRLLALPIMTELGHDAARALALVDLDHRRLATVPGSTVDPGYVFVAWAESGASVFITGGERFERRSILEYRLGSERAEPVRVDVGDFYGMAAS